MPSFFTSHAEHAEVATTERAGDAELATTERIGDAGPPGLASRRSDGSAGC